jgi:hypothetical protein
MSFSHELFHRIDLDGSARDDALHLRVFGFELLESSQITRAHARIFRSPWPDRIGMMP